MRSSDRQRKLLEDVISEGDYARFRQQAFKTASKEFRRTHRRTFKKTWLALAAMIVFAALLVSALQKRSHLHLQSLSQTKPLSEKRIASVEIISTIPMADRDVIRTVPNKALVVRTKIQESPISDSQLLALLKDQGAGFINSQKGRKFVFVPSTASEGREESSSPRMQ
jgi:hypothetical protein